MPNIENFIKTLMREKSEFVPIAELGVNPLIKEKVLNRKILTLQDDVDFWHKAGYDYVKIQPEANFNPSERRSSVKVDEKLDSATNFKWASEGKGIISSQEEFETFQFPSRSDFNYSKFDDVSNLLPEGMGVVGQYGDIFTMTWEMMGFESFSYALFEQPDLLALLNNKLGDLVLSMFEFMAEHDTVDVLFYSDDIAFTNGLLMPPDVLDKFFFPWLKKIGALAQKYNKPLIYHSDGILYDVMDKIIDCGVNSLHPIEPKAMEINNLKAQYGDQLSFIGHVEVDVLSRGTVDEVRELVKNNIELFDNKSGYCVGSSNSIPEYVKIENYLVMNESAKIYGARW
jgi:uroporphyrinogen decarboxylase